MLSSRLIAETVIELPLDPLTSRQSTDRAAQHRACSQRSPLGRRTHLLTPVSSRPAAPSDFVATERQAEISTAQALYDQNRDEQGSDDWAKRPHAYYMACAIGFAAASLSRRRDLIFELSARR